MTHDWQRKTGRFRNGIRKPIQQCSRCGLITFSQGRLTAWLYPDGRLHRTATIDAPTCYGETK